jgi:hypothetical protein
MRYYRIAITNASSGAPVRTYTSFANGKTIPGALNIELDIPVTPYAQPMGSAMVRVWGISLQDIGQASDLNNQVIEVYGGMQKGLPLAKPSQNGLIVRGQIFQAFGNWIGVDQTLDLIIATATGTEIKPKNIVLNWKAGTTMATAIRTTLSTAFPDYKPPTINIDPKLVLPADEVGFYENITQFAKTVKVISQQIIGGNDYAGVDITPSENSFTVLDGSTQTKPRAIAFEDMIGQPTWVNPRGIQFKCVMRADLKVNDYVKMPPSLVVSGAATVNPRVSAKSIFQGVFRIVQIRHVGNFRAPDAAAWITTIDANSVITSVITGQ